MQMMKLLLILSVFWYVNCYPLVDPSLQDRSARSSSVAGYLPSGGVSDYPSTFPFQNEDYVPDTSLLPDVTPDFSYTSSDPGGYFRRGYYSSNPFLGQTGFNQNGIPIWSPIGADRYIPGVTYDFFNYWGVHSGYGPITDFPWNIFNCTDEHFQSATDDFVFSSRNFPGVMNGEKINCNGDCCSSFKYYNEYSFCTNSMEQLAFFSGVVVSGACDLPEEVLYCQITSTWQWYCNERYLSPVLRAGPILPCFDFGIRWMLTCRLLKISGLGSLIAAYEPPGYIESTPVLGQFLILMLEFTSPDKVCPPYSYFFPDGSLPPTSNARIVSYFSFLLTFSLITI